MKFTNIFETFDNKTMVLLIYFFFWSFSGNVFVSLFFLNERDIATSVLMIHLKCAVAHHDNQNSSSLNKPYSRAVEYAISFFNFLFIFILTRLLWILRNSVFVMDGRTLLWSNIKNKQNVVCFWLYFFVISYMRVSKYKQHEPEKWRVDLFVVEKAFVTDGLG